MTGPYLIWVVPLIGWKFASSNQKHYPDLGSDASSGCMDVVISQMLFGGETTVVALQNVSCFLMI